MLAEESGGESTQAGVIITSDLGSTWKPFGEIVDATGRARMLEPTAGLDGYCPLRHRHAFQPNFEPKWTPKWNPSGNLDGTLNGIP
jgi:hypothetical protein